MIFEAADLGAEYWIIKKTNKSDAPTLEKGLLTETKLDGFQQKIGLFATLLRAYVRVGTADKMSLLMADFFDALTGGNFGARARPIDQVKARLVYTTAADLVAHLRATRPQPSWISIALGAGAALTILLLFLYPL
jgi:hypothetical protein